MDPAEFDFRLRIGVSRGNAVTCTHNYDYGGELTASLAATSMSHLSGCPVEAFPCGFCAGWHVGPAVTNEEKDWFGGPTTQG